MAILLYNSKHIETLENFYTELIRMGEQLKSLFKLSLAVNSALFLGG